jgi:hypothetical protein
MSRNAGVKNNGAKKKGRLEENKIAAVSKTLNLMCRAFESNFVLGQFGIVISKRCNQD